MNIERIPKELATDPRIPFYVVEPPNSMGYDINGLLSPDLDTIEGEQQPLGYSTTASILESKFYAKDSRFAIKVELGGTKTFVQAIAAKLLLEVLMSDVVPPRSRENVAQVVIENIPNYKDIVHQGQQYGFTAAAKIILPYLIHLPNPPESRDIVRNHSVQSILDCNTKKSHSLQDVVDIASEATSKRYKNRSMVALIDASGEASRRTLYRLVGQATGVGIMPKLIGPSRVVSDIMTGQTTDLQWDQSSLLHLSQQALTQSSRGKVNSLAAIMNLETRAKRLSPEEILIATMTKSGLMHPGVLIRAINQFLPWSENNEKQTKSQLDQVVTAIKNHTI